MTDNQSRSSGSQGASLLVGGAPLLVLVALAIQASVGLRPCELGGEIGRENHQARLSVRVVSEAVTRVFRRATGERPSVARAGPMLANGGVAAPLRPDALVELRRVVAPLWEGLIDLPPPAAV